VELSRILFGNLETALPTPWGEAICILTAFACGAIVGFEREKGRKPAGLRTQILICVGSAIFTIVSMSQALGGDEPARVAAQIVTGVGFLGAGSILRDRAQIKGLTTAATIWTVSAIGIVAGAGYATAALGLSFGVLFVLAAFRRVESYMGGPCSDVQVAVVYRPERGKGRALLVAALDEARGTHVVLGETTREDGLHVMRLRYCDAHPEHRILAADLAALPFVEALEHEPAAGPPATDSAS
jgi:putative Mg2+ transporter-C (MgtC) family protein